jgi:hypothetical protein
MFSGGEVSRSHTYFAEEYGEQYGEGTESMSSNEQIKLGVHLSCGARIYTNFGQECNFHPTSVVCYVLWT